MSERMILEIVSIVFSLTALAFLAYTILNLEQFKIAITHPRVLVESSLFLVFLVTGIYMLTTE